MLRRRPPVEARPVPLTVLNVAYPFAPVTVDPVGGAEQVLAQLDRALAAAGHRSQVIAAAGSQVAGDLIGLRPVEGDIDDATRAAVHAEVREAVSARVASGRVDVVHLHGVDFHHYRPPEGTPTVVTLHLPLAWYPQEALEPRPGVRLTPVSHDQARRAPKHLALSPPILNGVDLDSYRPGPLGDYALVLGRVAPEKGFHTALDAGRLAGVPVRAAGAVFPYPEHRRYFEAEVVPRLDASRTWEGAVEGAAKRRLLAGARCLLVPSMAPETSSLVAMEALASGAPVIALRAGALPEIVEHGVTGFLVDTTEEMAEAIGRAGEIDRAACRRAACARFSLRRTTDAYLDVYARMAA